MELGPVTFGTDGSQSVNPYSWNTEYNIMFVDQPVGVGYGYAVNEDIPKNQDEVASQFLYAMREFFSGTNGCIKKNHLVELK